MPRNAKDNAQPVRQVMRDKDFNRFSEFIGQECGIKLPQGKKTMLEARLQKRLRFLGFNDYKDYCEYVFSDKGMEEELHHLLDVVTTNTTDFFREPKHFEFLSRVVLPQWMASSSAQKVFTVWSAGCSTGEEPYTLAMVLTRFQEDNPSFRFRLVATDISTRVLSHALRAIYPMEKARTISPEFKKKYLLRSKDKARNQIRIAPEIRKTVEFKRLNFMEKFSFNQKRNIIFCRNVMIYFERPTQEFLLQKFCSVLNPGGYVFIGHSESLSGMKLPLKQVAPTIYQYFG